MEKQRVPLWIECRVSNLAIIRAEIDEMIDEEAWCLKWSGTENVWQALDMEFVEEIMVKKYVDLNQRIDKGKGVAEAEEAADDEDDDDDSNNEDVVFEEARKSSVLENYVVKREPSRAATTTATTTEPATTEILEEEVEEELVDFELFPDHFEVPCDPSINVARDYEEEETVQKGIEDDLMSLFTQPLESSAPKQ